MSFSAIAGIPVDPAIAVTTIASIGQLMVAILIGVLSSKRGILTKENVKVLSTINYNILLPCLSLSSVIRAFQTDVIVGLGILPIVAGLQILLGLALGFLFSKILKIESEADKRIMIVSSAYINGGTIALFLSSTLFGTNLVKSAEFIAAVSLYLIGWSVLFWTIGYSILTNWNSSAVGGEAQSTISVRETMANVSWKRVISPPIIATIVGAAIGFTKPLQQMFLTPRTPLNIVYQGVSGLGVACAPCAVLILAGSLMNPPADNGIVESPVLARRRSPRRNLFEIVLAVGVTRFIVFPVLTSYFLLSAYHRGWFARNSMVYFTILLESVMPPAQNIALVLQLENKPGAASRAAKILLILYIIALLPVSIFASLGATWFFGG
ncbi:hypothetical protein NDN08_003423 [Rhodosorus marinus]|uniref:Uncharacterized protein n=1 Tax=Rhodosorus marinus TaxID=101924 RepID=A0AAV8UX53_9RHOD|nr:hypothetical protein NDN08_003423 [Rhodosorus marinus]